MCLFLKQTVVFCNDSTLIVQKGSWQNIADFPPPTIFFEFYFLSRTAGGAFGKMEAAREEEYFRKKVG